MRATASDQLATAAERTPLDVADLELLAVAAYLAGRDDASAAAWSRPTTSTSGAATRRGRLGAVSGSRWP